MTRREIEAEIAAEERNERRALIFLKAIRTHVARHQADLQRLMGQCALEKYR